MTYVRTPEHIAWMKRPWTCPKCGTTMKASGKGPHSVTCGRDDELLWARVNKNGPNGCWIYMGACDRRGYGRPGRSMGTTGRTKRYYAHRRSYEIHKGEIPEGMLVLHKCDNPPCCNPEHLYLGRDADNARDRKARGRNRHRYTPVENLLFPHLSRRAK